jgi:hypothetical protein
LDVIEKMKDTILKRVAVNPFWAELMGYTVTAAILGNRFQYVSEKGPMLLNFYSLYVGESGLAQKTAGFNIMYEIMGEVKKILYDEKRCEALVGKNYEEVYKQKPTLLYPSYFTVEALIQKLGQKKEGITQEGLIPKDEFTTFFKEINSKPYLSDESEILCNIYSGSPIERITKTGGHDIVEKGYCISLLAACTPNIFDEMRPAHVTGGMMPRFCVAMGESDKVMERNPERWVIDVSKRQQQTQEIAEIAEDLCRLRLTGKFQNVYIGPFEAEIVEDYDLKNKLAIKESKDPYDKIYLARLTEKMLKIAALKHVVNPNTVLKGSTVNAIPESLVKYAIERTEVILDNWNLFLQDWKQKEEKVPVKSSIDYNDKLLLFIHQNSDDVMRSKIVNHFQGWGLLKLDEVIRTLVEAGRIELYSKPNPVNRKVSTWYKIRTDEPKRIQPKRCTPEEAEETNKILSQIGGNNSE